MIFWARSRWTRARLRWKGVRMARPTLSLEASPTVELYAFKRNLSRDASAPAAGAAAALGGPFTLGLSLIKINNGTLVNLELSALETDGRGKVIASPRIVTADQVEATIEQGSRIPFQQATSSGATSVVFRDATLRLKVTPQITPDNNVIMNLNVNQDSIGALTVTGVPTINTKQITTQVLVENGGTVVIGGIFSRDENTLTNRVPLLGNIPLLGNVFRNNAIRDNKTELLIFVTPRILKDSLNMR